MIRVKGVVPRSKEELLEAVGAHPQFVEIGTPVGMQPAYTGFADKAPDGRYFVRQGKIAALFEVTAGKVKAQ